jgi:hypothetical protein
MKEIAPKLDLVLDVENLIHATHLDRELILHFLIYFARAEYALKRAHYIKGNETRIDADWDKFASDTHGKFNAEVSEELSSATKYLLEHPPKKQALKNGQLAWVDSECGKKEILPCLLVLVRRVRNNLFHGGKFPTKPIPEVSRDRRLLESCLLVLSAALQLNQSVARFFSEEIR